VFDSTIGRDLRFAVRSVRNNPIPNAVAAFVLAVGIGGNAAVFGLFDALLLQGPAHVDAPDRLISLTPVDNYQRYLRIASDARTFSAASYTRNDLAGLGERPWRVECVTPNYFQLLGVAPTEGRTFAVNSNSDLTVVLAHHVWAREFGSNRNALSTTVRLGGAAHEIIGVMPSGFSGVEIGSVDAWILLTARPEACSFTYTNLLRSATSSWLKTVGRIRDPFVITDVSSELATYFPTEPSNDPYSGVRSVFQSRSEALSLEGRVGRWLAGGSIVLFLLACATVANILSMRMVQRHRDTSIRRQLGASRRRIAGHLVAEAAILGLLSACLAVILAFAMHMVLRGVLHSDPAPNFMTIRTASVVFICAATAAMLACLGPGVSIYASDGSPSLRRSHWRDIIVVVQVSAAMVLLSGAGLFAVSLKNVFRDLGYDLDSTAVAVVDLRKAGYRDSAQMRTVLKDILDRTLESPGITTAALSSGSALGSGGSSVALPMMGLGAGAAEARFVAVTAITPAYFTAVGTKILRGRDFTASDAEGAAPVTVISEILYREMGMAEDALDKCVRVGRQSCVIVVGVAESRRIGRITVPSHEYFIPAAQAGLYASDIIPQTLFARSAHDAAEAVSIVTAAIRTVEPRASFVEVHRLSDLADVQARSWRLGARAFGIFALLSVLLSGVGLYTVLALSVRQRTSEIGVRLALGAERVSILALVLRRVTVLVAAGWLLGAALALWMGHLLRNVLFEVSPSDPATFLLASLLVAMAACTGAVAPVLAATRVDPVRCLRHD